MCYVRLVLDMCMCVCAYASHMYCVSTFASQSVHAGPLQTLLHIENCWAATHIYLACSHPFSDSLWSKKRVFCIYYQWYSTPTLWLKSSREGKKRAREIEEEYKKGEKANSGEIKITSLVKVSRRKVRVYLKIPEDTRRKSVLVHWKTKQCNKCWNSVKALCKLHQRQFSWGKPQFLRAGEKWRIGSRHRGNLQEKMRVEASQQGSVVNEKINLPKMKRCLGDRPLCWTSLSVQQEGRRARLDTMRLQCFFVTSSTDKHRCINEKESEAMCRRHTLEFLPEYDLLCCD